MNKIAKVTILVVTTLAVNGGFAAGAFALDRVTTDITGEIADAVAPPQIGGHDVEIQHTEGPNPAIHKGVTDAVLGKDQANKNKLMLAVKAGELVLKCSAGSDDVLVANAGNIDLPAGTKLNWKVRETGDKGAATLTKGLTAGQKVKLADVLDGEVEWGTKCSAKVTGL